MSGDYGQRNLSGTTEKFTDLDKAPGCTVKYHGPKGAGSTFEWRPMWRNSSNPFQYDRNYLARQDIARQHVRDRRSAINCDTMARTAPAESAMAWTCHSAWRPQEGRTPRLNESSRSSLWQDFPSEADAIDRRQAFLTHTGQQSKSLSVTNSVPRLSGSHAHGHMPGYRGHISGYQNDDGGGCVVGATFANATRRCAESRLRHSGSEPLMNSMGGSYRLSSMRN